MPNAETLSRGFFAKINSLLHGLFVIKYPIIAKQNTERMKAMATTKTVNYTEEMTAQLHNLYAELGNEGLDKIAETIGKPVRSVRAKLVRDGIYVAGEKAKTAKKDGPSKKEILNEIEKLGFACDGLEGATKEALYRIKGLVRDVNGVRNAN